MDQSIELPFGDARFFGEILGGISGAVSRIQSLLQAFTQVFFRWRLDDSGWCSAENHREFPLGPLAAEVAQRRGDVRPDLLFVSLREFSRDLDCSSASRLAIVLLEELQDPMGGFVQNGCSWFTRNLLQAHIALTAFGRQKPLKAKSTARQSTADQGSGRRTGSWNADDGMSR